MDEQIIEASIRRLIHANDPKNLNSWMGLLTMANVAMNKEDYAEADQLFKLSVDFAEEKMSNDAVINALLCLSASYNRQQRTMEASTAFARAMKILGTNAQN